MARRDYEGNAIPTTLSNSINSTDLTINISASTGWPTGGVNGNFYVTVDRGLSTEERILCSSRTGLALSVASVGNRGVDGTSAVGHASGSRIEHTFSGVDADEANDHINTTSRDDHTQYLNNARHDVEARHQFGAALGTPGAPAAVGTAAAAGTGDDAAREDHVHVLGTGAINLSNMFGSGVVNAAAIGAGEVNLSKLNADVGLGAWTSYTPTVGQGATGNIAKTVTRAKYTQIGKTVFVSMKLAITGTGTASSAVSVTLPVTASVAGGNQILDGTGYIYDNSALFLYTGVPSLISTTAFSLFPTTEPVGLAGLYLGLSVFTAALASSDGIDAAFTYEAA